jgi:hypothetical protein
LSPYLEKNPSQKRAQGVGPEFKPQYHIKKGMWGATDPMFYLKRIICYSCLLYQENK